MVASFLRSTIWSLAITLIALISTTGAYGDNRIELWNGAFWGMTEAEVVSAVANARPPSEPDTLKDGSVERLHATGVNINGETYEAEFYFDSEGRLTQVTLSAEETDNYGIERNRFDSLVTLLRKRYGQELSLKHNRSSLAGISRATFSEANKNVDLVLIGIGENSSVLNIVYQARLAKEADKL